MEIILKTFMFGLIAGSSLLAAIAGFMVPWIICDKLNCWCKKLFKKEKTTNETK